MPWRVRIPGHAFAPVIIFIPCPEPGCKGPPDGDWLPRQCPVCQMMTIVGHGRRSRQAHDETQAGVVVRRGICRPCHKTYTVLPAGCIPGGIYNLPTRQQALERIVQGAPAEQAGPHCHDPDRIADPSTIRRWFWRRFESLPFLMWAPTLFAWDWRAASRILVAESISP